MTEIIRELLGSFLTAFILVLIATPSLIKVAKLKHLVDEPGDARKLHRRSVPTIGGIVIFAGTIIGYSLWFPSTEGWILGENYYPIDALNEFKYLVACMFILFFLGLKDDIIGVSPAKKLLVHMLIGFIIVYVADIRITQFWGLFGVDSLPYWISLSLSVFVYVVSVKAINLIEGVDGLAAGFGFIASIAFAYWFYRTGDQPLALLAVGLAGALVGFLVFNFQPAKLFMGDSGSLIIGLVLFVLAVKLIEFPVKRMLAHMEPVPKPVLAMAILAYPLIDTLRVFILRALAGRSPFSADKNHIHHKLLALGFSHRQTCFILYAFSIGIIIVAYLSPKYSPNVSFLIVMSIAVITLNSVFLIKNKPEGKSK
ncbi:MAG: glycosyltransferase family 4 protein [Flavobacteriales bacterium]